MDESITSRYELTLDDYIEVILANHRHAMRRPVYRIARWIFLGIVILMTILLPASIWFNPATSPEEKQKSLLLIGAFVAVLWTLVYLASSTNSVNKLYYRHHFRAIPDVSRLIEWGFDAEKLWSRTALAEFTFRWEMFLTIVETPKCILFYQGTVFTLWLPAHGFSSPHALRRFVEVARSKVPNYVVLGECQFVGKPETIPFDDV